MVRGGFRHLVVVEGNDVAGLLSMRDIVRCWTPPAATAEPVATQPVTTQPVTTTA
jgi:signal-transduction protein with cAMP-binding, CBS, and nucleotidyltransferase domain